MAFVQLWSGNSFPWKEEGASAREVLKVQMAIVLTLNALCVSLLVGPVADRANRMGVYVVFSEFLSLTDCLVGESVSKLASALGLCDCVH